MDDMDARGALQATLDAHKEEYSLLKVKFHEMQKGFLLGQLQDEMKEILLGELEEVCTYLVSCLSVSAYALFSRVQDKRPRPGKGWLC